MNSEDYTRWSEITAIMEKWNWIDIPPHILARCEEAGIKTRDFLLQLHARNLDVGNLSTNHQASERMGAHVAQLLARSLRASLILGIEYGHENPLLANNEEPAMTEIKTALPTLQAAFRPITEHGSQLIGLLLRSGHISRRVANSLAHEFGVITRRSATSSFIAGVDYASQIKIGRVNAVDSRKKADMYTFYTWPDADPKKCEVCRRRLKRSFVFGDTSEGRRHVAMCEKCFSTKGAPRATYGDPRRYVKIKGIWVSGHPADWKPEDIPDGTECVIVNNLTGEKIEFRFDRSKVGR